MFLKTSEAAAYLRVKPETLVKWRWAGKGPKFYRVGRTIRYTQVDLNDFVTAEVKR